MMEKMKKNEVMVALRRSDLSPFCPRRSPALFGALITLAAPMFWVHLGIC